MNERFIHPDYPLILASASPRRKRILAQVGIPFRAIASRFKEGKLHGSPAYLSRGLAEKKAREVYERAGESWILGADTLVTLDARILGKPEDAGDAKAMLRLLGGKEHRVVTGFCVVDPSGNLVHSKAVSTRVRFKPLSEEEIRGYVETEEPFGKAGSYAIQGVGAFMVERISGSYTNVVGLPICAVIQALVSVGALKRFPEPTHLTELSMEPADAD